MKLQTLKALWVAAAALAFSGFASAQAVFRGEEDFELDAGKCLDAVDRGDAFKIDAGGVGHEADALPL